MSLFWGLGAWSRCFGFTAEGEPLVVRFGRHVADFETDRLAHQFASPSLPIPKVLDIGEVDSHYFAISERVFGEPLEEVSAQGWARVVPSLADALEAMRLVALPAGQGVGELRELGRPAQVGWRELLLAVNKESDDERSHGRLAKLAETTLGLDLFERGYKLLEKVADDRVPIKLSHRDLINRNVFVQDGRISGLFDWGCSLLGDPLYDLAWFEFWSSWYPEMDTDLLVRELERRWRDAGVMSENRADRMLACHLHIGLDHLAYNAYTGDEVNLLATAERMCALVPGLRL